MWHSDHPTDMHADLSSSLDFIQLLQYGIDKTLEYILLDLCFVCDVLSSLRESLIWDNPSRKIFQVWDFGLLTQMLSK